MRRFDRLIRILMLISLTVGYLLISAFASRKLHEIPIRNVLIDIERYDDNFLVSKDEVVKICKPILEKEPTINRKAINTRLLEEMINREKSIEKTEIFFTLNGELHIQVKPRTPSMRILSSGNQYYVDFQNHAFPLSPHYSAYVPVVDGTVNDEILKGLNLILEKSKKDEFLKNFFIGFHVSPSGEITAHSILFKEKIYFGHASEVDEKLLRLKVFYNHIYPSLAEKKIKSVNLTFGKQVICEYEQ